MSALKNQVRIKCSRCGRYFTLKSLQTTQPDPDSKLLNVLAKQIAKEGLCEVCQAKHNYAAKKKLEGEKTDYHQKILTTGIELPGGPDRVICEYCGEGNHPMRETCRRCKKELNPRRLYDARGKLIIGG